MLLLESRELNNWGKPIAALILFGFYILGECYKTMIKGKCADVSKLDRLHGNDLKLDSVAVYGCRIHDWETNFE